jgi:hypothetical protein|tara:strand:- start:306 stop:533 length:228 start_codon:yes stop_codon:yes gene_type:complete
MPNNLEDDIKMLSNHESFARFIQMVHTLREETITELHKADYEQLQQVAGRIITYDQILSITDWDNLRIRHLSSLN